MDIINVLNYQLFKIEDLIKYELTQKEFTGYYFICEDKCKFLDTDELETYLTETKIENFAFLKTITQRCESIIELWDTTIKDIQPKKLKERVVARKYAKRRLDTKFDFYTIMLYANDWEYFNREIFINHYDYNNYSVYRIVTLCAAILGRITLAYPNTKAKEKQPAPKTFEELFYDPGHAGVCLSILRDLDPPAIDATNNYIGKRKGIFPLWIKVLKNHKPRPLIKHYKDTIYKDLLNNTIKGLNLSKDASEFRKQYKRLENNNTELEIKTILSQYSQSGKLGK